MDHIRRWLLFIYFFLILKFINFVIRFQYKNTKRKRLQNLLLLKQKLTYKKEHVIYKLESTRRFWNFLTTYYLQFI